MKKIICVAIILLTVILFHNTVNAIQYQLIDLGTIGDVRDINNNGQIVGDYDTESGEKHAFTYQNGVTTDLGSFNGNSTNLVRAVNDSGQIAGYSYTSINYQHSYEYSFLNENNSMTDIGTLGSKRTWATGINNSGSIVGGHTSANNYGGKIFIYKDGIMTDLGQCDSIGCSATDINNSGQIIGNIWVDYGKSHGFLYDSGQVIDLGYLDSSPNLSRARSINDTGQIVGYSGDNAFLYDNGQMIDLGTFGGFKSMANDINNNGQIVGSYSLLKEVNLPYKKTQVYSHAFFYDNGQMFDLANLGGISSVAVAINNNGQIVGYSTDSYNQKHAVLWNPINVVPEPISYILFVIGGTLLAGQSYIKRKKMA